MAGPRVTRIRALYYVAFAAAAVAASRADGAVYEKIPLGEYARPPASALTRARNLTVPGRPEFASGASRRHSVGRVFAARVRPQNRLLSRSRCRRTRGHVPIASGDEAARLVVRFSTVVSGPGENDRLMLLVNGRTSFLNIFPVVFHYSMETFLRLAATSSDLDRRRVYALN